jgi:hypothetical protein
VPAVESQRGQILLIRAWVEAGSLRGRVTEIADVRNDQRRTWTITTAEDLESAVRDWIARLEQSSGDDAVTGG